MPKGWRGFFAGHGIDVAQGSEGLPGGVFFRRVLVYGCHHAALAGVAKAQQGIFTFQLAEPMFGKGFDTPNNDIRAKAVHRHGLVTGGDK